MAAQQELRGRAIEHGASASEATSTGLKQSGNHIATEAQTSPSLIFAASVPTGNAAPALVCFEESESLVQCEVRFLPTSEWVTRSRREPLETGR